MDGAYIALKGYRFQFDKTIQEIFNNPSSEVKVEQVQDLGFDQYVIQVKHHDTDYPESKKKQLLKKPILQLLGLYQLDSTKHYVLYIFLKGEQPRILLPRLKEIKDILGTEANNYKKALLSKFIKNFRIIYADDFHVANQKVIEEIQKNYSKTKEEALFYYSLISSHLLDIVIHNPPSDVDKRIIKKADIDSLVRENKKLVFHSSYAEVLGKKKYHSFLKQEYFNTSLNLSPFDRYFIVEETVANPALYNLKELILTISKKWSKTSKRESQPFVPYIFIRGISDNTLIDLKNNLYSEGFKIKDGYEFKGSNFCSKSISESPSSSNNIKFRIVNNESQLDILLSAANRTKEVYQFFQSVPLNIETNSKHIKISIDSIEDVKTII